jgi:hypothetical protein
VPPSDGGAWNRDGVILIAGGSGEGLVRTTATGGRCAAFTTPDPERQETLHAHPVFLPDGRHFLYFRGSPGSSGNGIFVGSLDAGPADQNLERLLASDSGPAYAPSINSSVGYVLFVREGALMAQKFDSSRLAVVGEPSELAARVASLNFWGAFSTSNDGALVFRRESGRDKVLTWLDRAGRVIGTIGEPGQYADVALSPDGTRLAVSRRGLGSVNSDIWLVDLRRGSSSRFTFDPSDDIRPTWSRDGHYIAFSSNRDGRPTLMRKPSNGVGEEEVLLSLMA